MAEAVIGHSGSELVQGHKVKRHRHDKSRKEIITRGMTKWPGGQIEEDV